MCIDPFDLMSVYFKRKSALLLSSICGEEPEQWGETRLVSIVFWWPVSLFTDVFQMLFNFLLMPFYLRLHGNLKRVPLICNLLCIMISCPPCCTVEACSCLKLNYACMQSPDAQPRVPQLTMVSPLFLFEL